MLKILIFNDQMFNSKYKSIHDILSSSWRTEKLYPKKQTFNFEPWDSLGFTIKTLSIVVAFFVNKSFKGKK